MSIITGFFIGFGLPFGVAAGVVALILLWDAAEKFFDRKS